jgi:WD40 repeat protein
MLATLLALSTLTAPQSSGGTEALPQNCQRAIRPSRGKVQALDVSPDGKHLVIGFDRGSVLVHSTETGALVADLTPKSGMVWDVEFDPRGERLLTVHPEKAHVWNAKTLALEHTLGPQKHGMMRACFSPDGSRIATGSCGDLDDHGAPTEARVWDAATGEQLALVEPSGFRVLPSFSPNGKLLLIGSESSAALVFRLDEKRVSAKLSTTPEGIAHSAWSPDGKSVISAFADHTARIWNPGTGEETLVLRGHTGYVTFCEFSPDGKEASSTSWVDRTTRVWNVKTGKARLVLEGHAERPTQAHFAPDGRAFASADASGHALVFELANGKIAAKLDGHTDIVSALEFTPDSKRIVTGGFDGAVLIWTNPLAK